MHQKPYKHRRRQLIDQDLDTSCNPLPDIAKQEFLNSSNSFHKMPNAGFGLGSCMQPKTNAHTPKRDYENA